VYDAYNSVVSWMIAGGARIDERDIRFIEHERALRDATRSARRPLALFAWIGERLGATAPTRAACDPLTCSAA
jgi:hypothetical protein